MKRFLGNFIYFLRQGYSLKRAWEMAQRTYY
jgi:hypothetical protein